MTPWRIAIGLVAVLLVTAGRGEPTACPPAASIPTAEQMATGMKAARDRGFLWRIRKDGRSSYLYGTIHVGRFEWAFPGRAVGAALREADTVALEIDPADPGIAEALSALGTPPPLPAPLRERMERQFAAACVPGAALASMHPLMQAMMLTMLAARWEGLDPQFAQEHSLAGYARAARRPVVSLESAQLQMQALIPSDEAAMLRIVDRTLEELESGRVRPLMARLGRAWENGDLTEMEDYEGWCQCVQTDEERAQMRRLNDERNPHLAERIDALHKGGKKVFAAVGTLHMTGPMALPQLMAKRGYQVERIALER